MVAREQQELLQLAAKERGAARIIERQRRERVERPIAADVAPVERLDADDGDDDFRRHAKALLGAREIRRVRIPVRDAAVDARLRQELRRVLEPLRRLEQRPLHRGDDSRLVSAPREQRARAWRDRIRCSATISSMNACTSARAA